MGLPPRPYTFIFKAFLLKSPVSYTLNRGIFNMFLLGRLVPRNSFSLCREIGAAAH